MKDGRTLQGARDREGFLPIGDYAVIGDGRGVALVGIDGDIDWWAVPHLDSVPCFASVLDPANGCLQLRPTEDEVSVERRYAPHTNLLETTFTTTSGRVRVTDSLNSGNAGALPWSELARRIEGIEGAVALRFEVRPGDGLGSWEPWAEDDERGPVLHAGEVTFGVRSSEAVDVRVHAAHVDGGVMVEAGQRVILAVVASHSAPLYLTDVQAVDSRIDFSAANWRHWAGQVVWPGARHEQVVRSALALKLLMMARTGAIAAAATTSLPESVGGPKNWDYRFSWIRDAALTIDAMTTCGLQEEVHAAVSWLLRTIRRNGPDVHVMYTLDGDVPASSQEPDVAGYRGSLPVRLGNDAVGQSQLGIYGDLFGTVAAWVFGGHILDVGTARELSDLADRCADVWRHEDAGIWELPVERHYTSSKMNCWRALDCAARLADAGHISGPTARWRAVAAEIRIWIDQNCWSPTKQAYTFYAGTDELDASVLLGAHFGFERGQRMAGTIDAIRTELAAGPLLYRYSGVEKEEQTFIACAYWLVHALALLDRHAEAEKLMRGLDDVANDVGLLSEMCTPGTGELVGNIPQALSHLALINAAAALRRGAPEGES